MLPTIDSLIDKFASKFRIEQSLEEKENTVILHTRDRIIHWHPPALYPRDGSSALAR
jgi:hypothetical protein